MSTRPKSQKIGPDPKEREPAVSPFSLSDSELDELTSLAAAIPIEHRDGFLHAVADVIAQYPEDARGPGLMAPRGYKASAPFFESALALVRHRDRGRGSRDSDRLFLFKGFRG
jgi:hypothetical protein